MEPMTTERGIFHQLHDYIHKWIRRCGRPQTAIPVTIEERAELHRLFLKMGFSVKIKDDAIRGDIIEEFCGIELYITEDAAIRRAMN